MLSCAVFIVLLALFVVVMWAWYGASKVGDELMQDLLNEIKGLRQDLRR